MRRPHDSPLPLAVGLVFAVAVHLVAAPPASRWLSHRDRSPIPADLRIENIIVPDDVLVLSQPNSVSFDVVNRGASTTSSTEWEDRIYLSADDQLDSDDKLLFTSVHAAPLEPGQGYRSEASRLLLPEMTKPPFYLLFQTDARHVVDEGRLEGNNVRARRFDPTEQPQEPEVALGREDAPQRVTVAWISYEDFRELVAPESVTEQPTIQNAVEPIEAAPIERDPTPPQMEPTPQEPRTVAEAGGTLAEVAAPDEPTAPVLPPAPEPEVAVAPTPGPSAPAQPDIQQAPGEGQSTTDAAPAARDEPVRPTQAPRDEGEATPSQRYPERIDIKPGGTIVGKGIEVKTAHPDFSAVARATTLPRNPEAEIIFDNTGKVIDARIVKSSGSPNIDAPVLRCFYKWKASGKRIDELEGTLTIPITVILR